MLTIVTSLDQVDFEAFCQQSIPGMEASQMEVLPSPATYQEKKSHLALICNALLQAPNSMAWVSTSQEGKQEMFTIGIRLPTIMDLPTNGLFNHGREYYRWHQIMTFYTIPASIIFDPINIVAWIDWLAEQGISEITADILPFRKESIRTKYLCEDSDMWTDTSNGQDRLIARLWYQGKYPKIANLPPEYGQ